ncbi:MAG: ABC transporter ATP-binding protein [Rhodothalassiaceae bacterium]
MAVLELSGIFKHFKQGGRTLEVLNGVDLVLERGEIVALMGQSGAGKSTLLHIAGLLERPDAGAVRVSGRALESANDGLRTLVRLKDIGFVYQFHHLLPEFSALENVAMPMRIMGRRTHDAERQARSLLARVGLADRLDHRPAQLSGGEQQRVAIARALANDPKILLADEPTGNLDEGTAERVMAMLLEIARERELAALIATHNPGLADRMERRLVLSGGRVHPPQ